MTFTLIWCKPLVHFWHLMFTQSCVECIARVTNVFKLTIMARYPVHHKYRPYPPRLWDGPRSLTSQPHRSPPPLSPHPPHTHVQLHTPFTQELSRLHRHSTDTTTPQKNQYEAKRTSKRCKNACNCKDFCYQAKHFFFNSLCLFDSIFLKKLF